MKRLIIILAAFILVACAVPGTQTPTSTTTTTTTPTSGGSTTPQTGPPANVNLTGATGIYLQASMTAAMMRGVATGSTQVLKKIGVNGATSTATWTDSKGNALTVTVDQAEQVGTDYVLVQYTYNSATYFGSIKLADGTLQVLDYTPASWSDIFTQGDTVWYISGTTIYKVDLTTGTATAINAAMDPVNSAGWIYVDSSQNVFYLFGDYSLNPTTAKDTVYFADGTTYDFTSNNEANQFYDDLPGNNAYSSGTWIVLDSSTNNVHLLTFTNTELTDTPVEFNTGAPYEGIHFGAASTLLSGSFGNVGHYGPNLTIQNSIFAMIGIAFSVTSSGGTLSATQYDTSGVPTYSMTSTGQNVGVPTNFQYDNAQLYAGPTGTFSGVDTVTLASTATTNTIVNSAGITKYLVIAGKVFYWQSSGVSAYDTATGTTSQYSADPNTTISTVSG